MESKQIADAIEQIKSSEKANFEERIDLIVTFKELDLKKPDNQVDFFITLPNTPGKERKVAALVDVDLIDEAKAHADVTVPAEKFGELSKNKSQIRKVATEHDFFIAQGSIMKDVAANFGRILGSRGKMPNPKGGMVVPPKASLGPLVKRLRRTVHVKVKTAPTFQTGIGSVTQDTNEIVENVEAIYQQIVNNLPAEETNVKAVYLKRTMGSPVRVV